MTLKIAALLVLIFFQSVAPLTAGEREAAAPCGDQNIKAVVEASVDVINSGKSGASEDRLERAIESLECAARVGDLSAQLLLGQIYESGKVVEQDLRKSVFWFLAASDSGDYEAIVRLFSLYVGSITRYRVEDFFRIVEEHAAHDNLAALFVLGTSYCVGFCSDCDESRYRPVLQRVKQQAYTHIEKQRRLHDAIRRSGLYFSLVLRLEKRHRQNSVNKRPEDFLTACQQWVEELPS